MNNALVRSTWKRILLLSVILLIAFCADAKQPKFRVYIGLEKICWQRLENDSCSNADLDNPNYKWYRLNRFTFMGDTVFLSQYGIKVFGKDTIFSETDFSRYHYNGAKSALEEDSIFTIRVTEEGCEFCGELMQSQADGTSKRIWRTKEFICRQAKNGFWANDIFYKSYTGKLWK